MSRINEYVLGDDGLAPFARISPHQGPPLFIVIETSDGKAVVPVRAWAWTVEQTVRTASNVDIEEADFGPVALIDGEWKSMDSDLPDIFDDRETAEQALAGLTATPARA